LGLPLGQMALARRGGERGCRQSQILPLSGIGAHKPIVRSGWPARGLARKWDKSIQGTDAHGRPAIREANQLQPEQMARSRAWEPELASGRGRTYLHGLATDKRLWPAGGASAALQIWFWAQADLNEPAPTSAGRGARLSPPPTAPITGAVDRQRADLLGRPGNGADPSGPPTATRLVWARVDPPGPCRSADPSPPNWPFSYQARSPPAVARRFVSRREGQPFGSSSVAAVLGLESGQTPAAMWCVPGPPCAAWFEWLGGVEMNLEQSVALHDKTHDF